MNIRTGQRLKVTALYDTKPQLDRDIFEATGKRVLFPTIPAGTTYQGIASDVDPDGFFDLNFDDGSAICFYAFDSHIRVEEVAIE